MNNTLVFKENFLAWRKVADLSQRLSVLESKAKKKKFRSLISTLVFGGICFTCGAIWERLHNDPDFKAFCDEIDVDEDCTDEE